MSGIDAALQTLWSPARVHDDIFTINSHQCAPLVGQTRRRSLSLHICILKAHEVIKVWDYVIQHVIETS